MKRKYSNALLDAMKNNAKEVDVKGVRVLIKPIPEGGDAGDMDPRVYKSMKTAAFMMKFMPKSKKPKTVLEQVLPLRKMFNTYKGTYIADEGVKTEKFNVPSADGYQVPVRVYTRENRSENLPMFVYYHGGGFFGGGPDIVEQMCKLLVQKLDCVAFNVDYRLCPENHYPAPLDATLNLMSGMMGGDASQGNMLDNIYLQGNLNPEHIYASPLLDDMHDLPATMLIFGEHDFLAFEDFAYAQTAAKAGVKLKTIIYRGMGHGFADQIGVAPQAEDCMGEIAEYMKENLLKECTI